MKATYAKSRICSLGAAGAVAIALCAQPARAQLLNGGFETGDFNGWTTFGTVVTVAGFSPRSGAYAAAVAGSNSGNPNYTGFYQSHVASAGQVWQARGFVRQNAGTTLTGTANRLAMKIEFYRVTGGSYGGSDFLDEGSITVLDASSPVGTWTEYNLQAVAPAGTVEARIAFVFTQVDGAAGAGVVDDVTFATTDAPSGWDVVWRDEFDGPAVDPAKWRIEDVHLIKNNELQYYTPEDVYINPQGTGGESVLTLRSQARTFWGFDTAGNWRQFDYTSGLVDSRGKFAAVYGRWEVRARLPGTKGMWPAHWMLPIRPVWPPEIDIMEAIGTQPTRVVMSMHWGPVPPGTSPWDIGQTVSTAYWGPDYTQDYHTFAIEWWPGAVYWLVDDVVRAATARSEVPAEPMYLTLNTAVGGDWPGTPDATSVFPQYHEIDWVRFSVPSDPGPGIAQLADDTRTAADADGVIAAGEYSVAARGINSGYGDLLGQDSTLHLDSDQFGRLNIGIESHANWPASGSTGVVIYVDSRPGGFHATYALADTADMGRRMASGKGASGERGDLFFALGFLADYAICVLPNAVAIYELRTGSHRLVNGAVLGAATDVNGGDEVHYQGSGAVREVSLRLAHLASAPGRELRLVANVFNASTGQRYDEFVGAAGGNAWDGAALGAATVLKYGDFIAFRAAPPFGDYDADGDVDGADRMALIGCLAGPAAAPVPPLAAGCLAAFDGNSDGFVDLKDFAMLQGAAAGW
ncbi:MAG: glycoside hydrolase family 16 protein [Phycisphaerales bacterium]|nr:glycoside hydrolase family 16 protein [Phycisphaerales bacterium]